MIVEQIGKDMHYSRNWQGLIPAGGEKLQQVAAHLGVRRVANLAGCPAR